MASVGVARSSLGFQNGTSSSSDADRLPNELGNMSIRDDKVISSPPKCFINYCFLVGAQFVSGCGFCFGNNAGR